MEQYFLTFAALAAVVTAVSSFVNDKLFNLTGFARQVTSWVVAQAAVWVGYFAGFTEGVLSGVTELWLVAVYGIGLGLIANGIFDVPWVKTVLEFLKLKLQPPKPEEPPAPTNG